VQPLISIVIPTRNSSRTLDSCLSSIQNQSYSNIELIIVDSESFDNTLEIAKKYSAKLIKTKYKVLGARFLGLKASKGNYILYLDSDQILVNPYIIEHSLSSFSNYDMLCLEEESYMPHSFLQKLIDADRKLVNSLSTRHLDPLEGVLIPRFYKYSLLECAFKKLAADNMPDIEISEDCLIYYHAYSISSKIGIIRKALMHKDPSSIITYFCKHYMYGKGTGLFVTSHLYQKLSKRNIQFRKGLSFNLRSIQSIILALLRNVPFLIGVAVARGILLWNNNDTKSKGN
jgi:glycosyltransferase involved in cell wall biosynthesis